MTGYDLVLQFLGTVGSPVVVGAAILLTCRVSRAWRVRLGTGALAGLLGAVAGSAMGGPAVAGAFAGVSVAAGLLVAEVTLHVVPPVALLVLGWAAGARSWIRRRRR